MSKFLRRVGTSNHKFSYDITIHRIQMTLNKAVRINVVWKRSKNYIGNKRIETKNKPALSPSVGFCDINETLTMLNTLYMKKNGEFVAKKAVLTVQAIVEGQGVKGIGKLSINLSEYHAAPLRNHVFKLESCPDRFAQICISIEAQSLGEGAFGDNMSDVSGGSGFSMGTEGNYAGSAILGPPDQDLSGFEEEKRVVQGTGGRPPLLLPQQPLLKLTDSSGPVNPLRIQAAMGQHGDLGKVQDLKAQVSVLEKENQALRSERDELKEHLSLYVDNTNNQSEQLLQHIKYLDERLKESEKSGKKAERRVVKYEERLNKYKEIKDSMLADLKKVEQLLKDTEAERVALKNENLGMRKQIQELTHQTTSSTESLRTFEAERAELNQEIQTLRSENRRLQERIDSNLNQISSGNSDQLVNQLRKNLQESEVQRENALSKQTQILTELQHMKSQMLKKEQAHRAQILSLEQQIHEANVQKEEALEQIEMSKQLMGVEQKHKTQEYQELNNKISRITTDFASAKNRNAELESMLAEYERKLFQRESTFDSEIMMKHLLEQKFNKLQQELEQQKQNIKSKDKQIRELQKQTERLTEEANKLSKQLKLAQHSEFSDPAMSVLQEQVNALQVQLDQQLLEHQQEISQYEERLETMEKENQILHTQKQKLEAEFYVKLQAQKPQAPINRRVSTNTAEVLSSAQDNSLRQQVNLLSMENSQSKERVIQLEEEKEALNKHFLEAKLGWTNASLEKEELMKKYRDAQERLRTFSAEYTALEVELYRINDKFGQSINYNNELEQQVNEMKRKLQAK